MSQDVDRDQVFKTTRVRTLLKKDSSWIHGSARTGKDSESTECPVETKPTVTRQRSYVSSTAQKFELPTLPLSPPKKTRFQPYEGVSGYHAKADIIPSPKDAQPEASTVEATDKIKPHVTTEEQRTNSNAKLSLTNEKLEAVSVVQQNDQPKSNSTKERIEECVENTTEGLTEVSAGVCVRDPVVETLAEAVVPTGEPKPEKRHSAETDLANVTSLQSTGEESPMQTAKGTCARDAPRESSETVAIKISDDTVVESLSGTIHVTNTAPEDVAVQQISVELVPDSLAHAVSKSPSQTGDQTSVQGNSEENPPPAAAGEAADDEVKLVVASANEITSVTSPTREDGVPHTDSEGPLSEFPKSAEEESAQGGSEGCPTGHPEAESAGTEPEVVVEPSIDTPAVSDVGHKEVVCPDSEKPTSDLQENSASESPIPAAAESKIEQSFVVLAEPVEAVNDLEVETSAEIPAVTDVVLEGEVLRDNVEPGPDLLAFCVSAPPAQFADEAVTEKVEAEAEIQTPVVNDTVAEKDACPVSLAQGVSQSLVEPSAKGNDLKNPSVVAVGEAEVITEVVVESPTEETCCLDTENLSSDSQVKTHCLSENCEKCPETTEAAIEVKVKSEAPQGCVEPGPESLAEVSFSRQATGGSAEVATAVTNVVESSADMPAVTDVTLDDVSSQCIVEPEPDSAEPVSESHTESFAEDSNEACLSVHNGGDTSESEVVVSAATGVAETPPSIEVVEALAEALVPTLPLTPAVNNTVLGEGEGVQNTVEPGPDSQPEPAEDVVESSLETSARADAAQEDDSKTQTEDALEPKVTLDCVQSKLAERVIELTDALDEAPITEAQCVKDSRQSSKGYSKVEQGPNDTNINKTLEKPGENQGPAETQTRDEEVCSLCNQTFGSIRIRISDPSLILHPDCFKCGVCGKLLGDLLSPMCLLKEVIHCEDCHP